VLRVLENRTYRKARRDADRFQWMFRVIQRDATAICMRKFAIASFARICSTGFAW